MKLNHLLQKGQTNAYIPVAKAVDFNRKFNNVIDPYVLGVIIGDGGISSNGVRITNSDENIIEEVRRLLPTDVQLNKHLSTDRATTYGIVGVKHGVNSFTNELKDLDLMYKNLLINIFHINIYMEL